VGYILGLDIHLYITNSRVKTRNRGGGEGLRERVCQRQMGGRKLRSMK